MNYNIFICMYSIQCQSIILPQPHASGLGQATGPHLHQTVLSLAGGMNTLLCRIQHRTDSFKSSRHIHFPMYGGFGHKLVLCIVRSW